MSAKDSLELLGIDFVEAASSTAILILLVATLTTSHVLLHHSELLGHLELVVGSIR
jgi:hypothetical protein